MCIERNAGNCLKDDVVSTLYSGSQDFLGGVRFSKSRELFGYKSQFSRSKPLVLKSSDLLTSF